MVPEPLEKQIATDFRLAFDNSSGARVLKALMADLCLLQPLEGNAQLACRHDMAIDIIHYTIGGKQYTSELIDVVVDAVLGLARINQIKEKQNG